MPDGSRVAVVVRIDPRIANDTAPDRAAQLSQMAAWIESDLLAVLKKTGYEASASSDPVPRPGPGRFVLHVWIDDYNLGLHEVRLVIGHSRGAAGLRSHFALYGGGSDEPLLVGSPDVEAKRDWQHAARVSDLQTADAVNARLHQK
ncbi:MAG: hypothetical protein JWN04_5314 [Myxococcaceae bacterium]|nr:hypothetical protein [Myxococcaceae bacterium]